MREWGTGPGVPLVLLHGGGANLHWWDHLAPGWAESRRVIGLDFRGHGDSDHPEERLVGAFNQDLEALIAHLGTEAVVLVGHSMGAHIALDHASRHQAVRGVVLIDPSRGASRKSRRRARLALAFKRSYPSREEAIARYRFLPSSEHASESLRASIAEASVRPEDDGRWGYKFDPHWFSLPSRPAPDLSSVTSPTLVIRGGESALLSDEGAAELAAQLPNASVEVVPNAGHHVLLDAPVALARIVADFVAGLPDPSWDGPHLTAESPDTGSLPPG
jgi:pimeloyl-ACP methyl ester carboxylesterase